MGRIVIVISYGKTALGDGSILGINANNNKTV